MPSPYCRFNGPPLPNSYKSGASPSSLSERNKRCLVCLDAYTVKCYVPDIFADKRDHEARRVAQGYEPGESPDDLKKLIGELTVQNELLKKSCGLLGK
jgi:hypothetical protein